MKNPTKAIKNAIQREILYLDTKRKDFAKHLCKDKIDFTEEDTINSLDLSMRIGSLSAKIKQWAFILDRLEEMRAEDYNEVQLAALMVRVLGFGRQTRLDWSTEYISATDKVEMIASFMEMLSWGLGDSDEDQRKKSEMKGIAKGVGFTLNI